MDTLLLPKDPKKIRILLVGGHPAVLDALALLLRTESDLELIGTWPFNNAQSEQVRKAAPDLILLDFDPPSSHCMLRIRELRRTPGNTKLLVYTACSDEEILLELISLSVEGLVHKSNDTPILLKSIRSVARGEFWVYRHLLAEAVRRKGKLKARKVLTSREQEVVRLVLTGATNKEIGDRLGLSVLTVKRHLSNIFDKLDITSRMQLASRFAKEMARISLNPK